MSDAPSSDPIPPNDAASGPVVATEIPSEQALVRRPSAFTVWFLTLAAGLIAGLCSWYLAESIYGHYPAVLKPSKGFPSAEESNANAILVKASISTETNLTSAVMGAVLGLAFGLIGGVARSSIRTGLTAGVLGLALGAAGGFLASRLLLPIFFTYFRPDGNDLALAIVIQGAVAGTIGAFAGAAFGLGLGDGGRRLDLRCMTGGLLGAIVGVTIYQMAGGILFPMDRTTQPLGSTWASRLFAQESIAFLVAVGIVLACSGEAKAARKKGAA